LSDLTRRLDTLHDTLQRRPAGPTADLSGLESLVRSLAEKIEAARGPDADGRALDALERQIAAMAQTMDRSGEGFTALRSMERSIGDLFAKIEDAKRSTIHAAEQAAVKAASETVARTPGPQSPLAAAMADSKTRETLVAVQETLEKIVERLGMLESDMASDRVRMLDVAEQAVRGAPAPAVAAPVTPTAQKIAAAAAAAEAAKAIPPRGAKSAEPTGAQSIAAMVRATASRALQTVTDADRALPAAASGGATDMLLEPGSGRPDSRTAALSQSASAFPEGPSEPLDTLDLAGSAAPGSAPAEVAPTSFIAAARKAAQATPSKGRVPLDAVTAATKGKAAAAGDRLSALEQVKAFVNSRRRPLLIGVAAVMLAALTASQLGALFGGDPEPMPPPARPAAVSQPAPARPAPAVAQPEAAAPAQAPLPVVPPPAPSPAKPQASLGGGGFSPSGPIQPGTNFAPVDPVSVGSIGRAPSAPVAPAAPAVGPDVALPAVDMPVGSLPRALQKAAAAGQPAAAYEIATRIADGRGVTRDAKLSAKWFERAAQQNVAAAQYRLGSLYEKGIGVSKDVAAARSWYLKAAEQGNAKAMHNLGVIIADGAGAKPDYASAATWFRRAADFGVRDSQYNLAILTARGLGVEQNLADSWVWFALAAQQGDEDAAKKRDEVGARLGTDALATARRSFESFRPRPQDPAANDVAGPAGGWDVEQPVVKDKSKSG
ncbi:MAG: tetratricopeptide repeat protein, partial [Alsobacter sp.]